VARRRAREGRQAVTPIGVQQNEAASQFEVRQEDQLAVLQYDRLPRRLVLLHTGVPSALAGRGIGSALVRAALVHAREEGLLIVPRCPFVRAYLQRHPEDATLINPAFTWPAD
jgi:predicted GNAT family acetyltransferase